MISIARQLSLSNMSLASLRVTSRLFRKSSNSVFVLFALLPNLLKRSMFFSRDTIVSYRFFIFKVRSS